MIKVIFLFLSTGISLVVAVALIVGIAWLAVPVLIATGAGYGVVALRRHGSRRSAAIRAHDRSATNR